MGRFRRIQRNTEILRLYCEGIPPRHIGARLGMSANAVSSVILREKRRTRCRLPDVAPNHCRFCGKGCRSAECRGCRRMWREIHS